MLLQSPPQLGALIPESIEDELERAVAGRLGDAQVEIAIDRFAHGEIVGRSLELSHARSERFKVVGLPILRRKRCDLAFDQLARIEKLERAGPGIGARAVHGRILRGHENAGADTHLDQPAHFERDDRFAHGRAAHTKRNRELALGRQAGARLELALRNQLREDRVH